MSPKANDLIQTVGKSHSQRLTKLDRWLKVSSISATASNQLYLQMNQILFSIIFKTAGVFI